MNQKEALTILMRNHMPEFRLAVNELVVAGSSRRAAKSVVVRTMANKYQTEYVRLRGKNIKKGRR